MCCAAHQKSTLGACAVTSTPSTRAATAGSNEVGAYDPHGGGRHPATSTLRPAPSAACRASVPASAARDAPWFLKRAWRGGGRHTRGATVSRRPSRGRAPSPKTAASVVARTHIADVEGDHGVSVGSDDVDPSVDVLLVRFQNERGRLVWATVSGQPAILSVLSTTGAGGARPSATNASWVSGLDAHTGASCPTLEASTHLNESQRAPLGLLEWSAHLLRAPGGVRRAGGRRRSLGGDDAARRPRKEARQPPGAPSAGVPCHRRARGTEP